MYSAWDEKYVNQIIFTFVYNLSQNLFKILLPVILYLVCTFLLKKLLSGGYSIYLFIFLDCYF